MRRTEIDRAAEIIQNAEALVVTAGAGMGVDSGLPDFRGRDGFWRAYPQYRELGLEFEMLATPGWFEDDPKLAWGFYGHRLGLYRRTVPHEGFRILLDLARTKRHGLFVLTSNVDGQFQKAGFPPDRIVELHGTIHFNQCVRRCGAGIFPAGEDVRLDAQDLRALPPLPACPRCRGLARPNILMFDDFEWDGALIAGQRANFKRWGAAVGNSPVAVIELGAGEAVPTVRHTSERIAAGPGGTLIRINPRDYDVPRGHLGLPLGALEGLRQIAGRIPTVAVP